MFEWLNEYSRRFLSRGYLLPGQTPEQRIEEIAQKAEEYLKINGFAKKFFKYMSLGFYSLLLLFGQILAIKGVYQ
jgi:ribonucleoside-diphosphate reductase alpha chain